MTAQQARHRRRDRRRDHRPRVGRHQGAEQAAAEVVGVDLLRHHRLGHRLLDRLSGLADARRLHQGHARLQPARDGGRRGQGGASRARRGSATSSPRTPLDKIKSDPDLLRFAMAGGAAAFQTNCAPCHGRGAQGFAGYPNLNDDDWLWGGTHRGHPQDHQLRRPLGPEGDARLADAALRPRQAARRRRRSTTSPSTCCRCPASRPTRRRSREARRSSPSSAPACHGADGKGKQEQGAPNLTDGIWLYGGSQAGDRREHQDRPRRHDAGLGRPPRSRHPQVARRLRAQPRRRQVARARRGHAAAALMRHCSPRCGARHVARDCRGRIALAG